MSFVAIGGDAGSRPTFFEVYAADRLVPSLRAAVVYSLSVRAGQRGDGVGWGGAHAPRRAALAAAQLRPSKRQPTTPPPPGSCPVAGLGAAAAGL